MVSIRDLMMIIFCILDYCCLPFDSAIRLVAKNRLPSIVRSTFSSSQVNNKKGIKFKKWCGLFPCQQTQKGANLYKKAYFRLGHSFINGKATEKYEKKKFRNQ